MALSIVAFRNLSLHGFRPGVVGAVESLQQHQQVRESSIGQVSKTLNDATLRRGTGGRSSFSGVVATVFGPTGLVGPAVINRLGVLGQIVHHGATCTQFTLNRKVPNKQNNYQGKIGSQVVIPYRCDHYDVLPLKMCGDLGQILFFPFNLKDEESLYKAMKYSNVVINLIGSMDETSNFSYEDVHVTGPRNIARIAKELGIKRLIHVSSLNAVEKPDPIILKGGSRFLASKWRGEQAVREVFPEATIFQPSEIWGEADQYIYYYPKFRRYGLNRTIPLYKKGVGVIKQPVYFTNVAEAIVNSIFQENSIGKTYQAVGPRRYELKELVEWFLRVMWKDLEGHRVSDLRYSPAFWSKVLLNERIFKVPYVSREKLEWEHVTDVVKPGLPTLEDLGVTLTMMEERMHKDLRRFRAQTAYNDAFGEYPPAIPPKLAIEDL